MDGLLLLFPFPMKRREDLEGRVGGFCSSQLCSSEAKEEGKRKATGLLALLGEA